MITCSRRRQNKAGTCPDRPSNTAAVKEFESKLLNSIAERHRQDTELFGVNVSEKDSDTLLKK